MRRVLINAGPIVHVSGEGPLLGKEISEESSIYEPGMGIVIDGYRIAKIATSEEISEEYASNSEIEVIDVNHKAIIPGIVDSHSHLLWSGDRSREVRWKQQGISYQEIAERGGGIGYTVSATRKSSDIDLKNLGISRLKSALRSGTTHMEIKSGYGLDTESECRLLKIGEEIAALENLPSLDITWLGAHAAPPGGDIATYTEEILSEQLPAVIDQGIARNADVFCEPGWFNVEQSEDILKSARNGGLDLRIHIDEFVDGGGGDLAADLEVSSADHCHYTNNEARHRMNDAGVNTGFLPGTPYSMGSKFPPFKQCIEENIVWSIASDFNPNCKITSLPFLGSLLVQRSNIDPLITLAACTRNSALTTPHPSGLVHGQITEGGIANLNVVNSEHWEAWCLQPGDSPFSHTILEGELISH